MKKTNMYPGAVTWNPFKGCLYDCVYCEPSYKAMNRRLKNICQACYEYRPHQHPERLDRIPSAPIVFVCGNGDISFCNTGYLHKIIASIKRRNSKRPDQTYYFQSKNPETFNRFKDALPGNAVLLITLETNRNKGYRKISKAPGPVKRYRDFLAIDYPRKVITVEPILDFDLDCFLEMLVSIQPEYIWLGFNSRPAQVQLPEPSYAKTQALVNELTQRGIEVRGKELRKRIVLPEI